MNHPRKIVRYLPLIISMGISAGAHASPVSVSDNSSIEYSGAATSAREFNLAAATRGAVAPTQRTIAMDKATPTGLVLSTGAEASLWNFIACIHAQQRDRAFEHFESDLRHLDHLPTPHPVSAVPLPGSAWLLLIGLMGVVGSRVMPRRERRVVPADTGRPLRRGHSFGTAWLFGGTGRTRGRPVSGGNFGLQAQAG